MAQIKYQNIKIESCEFEATENRKLNDLRINRLLEKNFCFGCITSI